MPNPIGPGYDMFDPGASLKPKLRLAAGGMEMGGGMPPGLGGPFMGVGGGGMAGMPPRPGTPLAEARKRMALKPVTI